MKTSKLMQVLYASKKLLEDGPVLLHQVMHVEADTLYHIYIYAYMQTL